MSTKPDLTVNIGGLQLQNPVMTAIKLGSNLNFDINIDLIFSPKKKGLII